MSDQNEPPEDDEDQDRREPFEGGRTDADLLTVTVTDPREQYDDLLVRRDETTYDPETFERLRGAEAFESGWVAVGAVVDDDGRVLLVREADHDAWHAPGGTVQPGEDLADALVREVCEETGVPVVPERPHLLTESVHRCDDETLSFGVVTWTARPERTEIPPDAELGVADETVETADWFRSFPSDAQWTAELETVLERLDRW